MADGRRLLISYEGSNGVKSSGVAHEAKLGGLFIETKTPLAVGALLSIELSSPTSAVTLDGRVFSIREKSEGPDRPAGMSIRFLDLPAGTLPKLQAILDQHRPPAHTRLGVGDENEMLWASAGGRDDDPSVEHDALQVAASIQVEGRPTAPEIDPPQEVDDAPKAPRHPTPRMIPLSTPRAAHSQPPSSAAYPASHPPPPMSSGQLPLSQTPRNYDYGTLQRSGLSPLTIGLIVVGTIGLLAVLAFVLAHKL